MQDLEKLGIKLIKEIGEAIEKELGDSSDQLFFRVYTGRHCGEDKKFLSVEIASDERRKSFSIWHINGKLDAQADPYGDALSLQPVVDILKTHGFDFPDMGELDTFRDMI